jgi:hypothetical protein
MRPFIAPRAELISLSTAALGLSLERPGHRLQLALDARDAASEARLVANRLRQSSIV